MTLTIKRSLPQKKTVESHPVSSEGIVPEPVIVPNTSVDVVSTNIIEAQSVKSEPEIFVTGMVKIGKKARVFLSDGRTAYSERGEIQLIGHRYCVVFGETNRVKGR